MQKLPKNPFLLGAVYAIAFGVLIVGINMLILWFFGLQEMAFVPWFTYKLIYTVLLSIKITEFCIFRYVQPDWASAVATDRGTDNMPSAEPVQNPLPKISVFKEMFSSVTTNIALNIIIGTALGGIIIGESHEVVIYPTTVQGIPITGLIFGFITGFLVTNGVTKAMRDTIIASGSAMTEEVVSDRRLTWMPKRKATLTGFVCICVMAFSAVALWAIMTLFEISVMNFYQFTVFITVYASILGKPLSGALVRRCTQPDYINHVRGVRGTVSIAP